MWLRIPAQDILYKGQRALRQQELFCLVLFVAHAVAWLRPAHSARLGLGPQGGLQGPHVSPGGRDAALACLSSARPSEGL